jgi:hypothetical protein
MSALFKKAVGHNPPNVAEYLPRLSSTDVTNLWKCHQKDLGLLDNGIPKYNKVVFGPNFADKWTKLCEKSQKDEAEEATGTKEARPKAMSAKDMHQEVKDGKYKSELAYVLTSHHCGESIDPAVKGQLDIASYYNDLVRKFDKTAYSNFVAIAVEIEAKLVAESNKVASEGK